MTYAISYVLAAAVFAALDILWLTNMGSHLYRQVLGDILVEDIRKIPAIAFYLMYPAGLVLFAVAPAIKNGTFGSAFIYGALFGMFTYGTYELTNYATLRNWTLQITLIDIAYGMIVSGLVALFVTLVLPSILQLIGGR